MVTRVTTADNVYVYLQNKSNRVVTITYNDRPSAEDAKTYRLRTIGSEWGIRYREWVENNLAYVNEVTGGEVGYVHIPDMGEGGLREFCPVFLSAVRQAGDRLLTCGTMVVVSPAI